MKDISTLCTSCMKGKGSNPVCPHCGFNSMAYTEALHHLKRGSILGGKYLVGNSIGEGGFGITYVGYDLNLEMKVAIKEYFPNGFVSRDTTVSDTVSVFSGQNQEFFEQGRQKFINEAKALAKFDNLEGIVSVKDFFMENGTAYIAMEYVEGETLKDFLKRSGGKATPEAILAMMQPLMKSLSNVHNQGIIHRDISPDNIMITKDSQVKLLDFGAARDISPSENKSLSIQLKPGYAPEEQYRSHGKQGPWTDVYALCATIYRAITGIQPMESLERMHNDELLPPSAVGIDINPRVEEAIMRGLAVSADQRLRSIDALYNALFASNSPEQAYGATYNNVYGQAPQQYNRPQMYNNKKSNLTVILAVLIGAVMLLCAAIGLFLVIDNVSSKSDDEVVEVTPTPTVRPAPVFTKIEASSTRGFDKTSGTVVNYPPSNVMDGDYTTAWSSDRSIEITPTLTLYADTKQYVTGIKMSNGYFKTQETYTRNRRITKVRVEYEGGEKVQYFDIDQFRIMQDIRFDVPAETHYISIHVLDSHYGDWKDICISEIEVY